MPEPPRQRDQPIGQEHSAEQDHGAKSNLIVIPQETEHFRKDRDDNGADHIAQDIADSPYHQHDDIGNGQVGGKRQGCYKLVKMGVQRPAQGTIYRGQGKCADLNLFDIQSKGFDCLRVVLTALNSLPHLEWAIRMDRRHSSTATVHTK